MEKFEQGWKCQKCQIDQKKTCAQPKPRTPTTQMAKFWEQVLWSAISNNKNKLESYFGRNFKLEIKNIFCKKKKKPGVLSIELKVIFLKSILNVIGGNPDLSGGITTIIRFDFLIFFFFWATHKFKTSYSYFPPFAKLGTFLSFFLVLKASTQTFEILFKWGVLETFNGIFIASNVNRKENKVSVATKKK